MGEKDEARDVTVDMQELKVNLSPDAFHIYATHYYKCKRDFTPPDDYFSPIPYFLLCRAIELEIKARHLKRLTQKEVRFGHRLLEAYEALDAQEQNLSQKELAVLKTADGLYQETDFAYFNPAHAHPFTSNSNVSRPGYVGLHCKEANRFRFYNVGMTSL